MPNRYLGKRANSFFYAFKGIGTLIATQPNAAIHMAATVLVIFFGFLFNLDAGEWLAITLSVALVWITEAINTSLEFLTNLVSPEYNPLAGKVKDLAAAAVLIAAIFAVIVGLIIFLPRIAEAVYPHVP